MYHEMYFLRQNKRTLTAPVTPYLTGPFMACQRPKHPIRHLRVYYNPGVEVQAVYYQEKKQSTEFISKWHTDLTFDFV